MNLALVDPFILAKDIPEALTGRIRSGHSTALRFNRKGDLLASGRVDGTLVIFDVDTNGVARKLRGHTRQIQSLSWSCNGRYLLSSGQDCKSILWDLESGERLRTVRFEAPVYIAELDPSNHFRFVAALYEDAPMLVDISSEIPIKHQIPTIPQSATAEAEDVEEKQSAQRTQHATSVTIFNGDGSHILTGTSRGWVNIVDADRRLSSSGRELVCNANDRIIRTMKLPDLTLKSANTNLRTLEVEQKYQDLVQRFSWNHATFSSTDDYVAASAYMNHNIYVWERDQGSLIGILETPPEELGIIDWHPHRPLVVACGLETGRIYLWSVVYPQRWSALAPDFAEIEENVEYMEKEDEFDIHPVEEITKRRLDMEDDLVDVLTAQYTAQPSNRGFKRVSFSMPVLLDICNSESEDEMVEVGPGVMRRRSPGEGKDWKDVPGGGNSDDRNGNNKGVTRKARRR